ncbi:hypothetical protein COO60DRAFT_1641176 [Scenedesmus sp. NREL 46B-D3]|nr:hypothetical protein COO60DRAFT_1641176 [Scenedesmus sp. NREL 46B-D3]
MGSSSSTTKPCTSMNQPHRSPSLALILAVSQFNCHPDVCKGAATWRELYKFNAEAFKYMLAQTAAEALMKLGIRATAQNLVLNVQGISAA